MPELSVTDLSKEIKDAIQALEVSGDLEASVSLPVWVTAWRWVYGLRALPATSRSAISKPMKRCRQTFALNETKMKSVPCCGKCMNYGSEV